MQKLIMLLSAGLLLPAIWGVVVYWLAEKCWPVERRRRALPSEPGERRLPTDFWDYQI